MESVDSLETRLVRIITGNRTNHPVMKKALNKQIHTGFCSGFVLVREFKLKRPLISINLQIFKHLEKSIILKPRLKDSAEVTINWLLPLMLTHPDPGRQMEHTISDTITVQIVEPLSGSTKHESNWYISNHWRLANKRTVLQNKGTNIHQLHPIAATICVKNMSYPLTISSS